MRDKDLIEITQFFRLWDELFLPHQRKKRTQRKSWKKNEDKVVFIVGLDHKVASELMRITKKINGKPSFIIQTILNDYFNVKKLK